MNRYSFSRPKEKWNPAFMLGFITRHPGLSSSEIKHFIASEYGLRRTVGEVHAMVYVLRKNNKVKISGEKGPKGGMTYEPV